MSVSLLVQLSLTANGEAQLFRQRIYNGYTHPMEAARHLVRVVIKLTASVQNRHDDLCRRNALFVLFCRYTSTVITDTNGLIWVNNNIDLAAMAS